MLKTAFVVNLSYNTTEADLQDLLEEYSPTHIHIVVDRDTQRSRGFGFVEFNNANDFEDCLQEVNGLHFQGRVLTVTEAEPKKKHTRSV